MAGYFKFLTSVWSISLFFSLLINLYKPGENILLPPLPCCTGFSHAVQCLHRHRCRAQPPRHTILNIYEDQNDYQLKQKNGLDFSNFAPTSIINSNSYTVWQKMKVFLLHIFHTSIPEKNDRRQDEALFIFFSIFKAKRIQERLGIQTSSSFVKIW